MENSSNSESNLLHPELSREEAIRRINAKTKAMMEAGASWIELKSWADIEFYCLPEELKLWKIPEDECEALLERLSQQDREKFCECIFFYYTSARTDASSCTIMHSFFSLAGIQNKQLCLKLYHKLTGASYDSYGFDDWTQVKNSGVFRSYLRRARAVHAVEWLREWKFRQTSNKETTQGDK